MARMEKMGVMESTFAPMATTGLLF